VDVDQARVHEICWQPPAWRRTGSGRALAIALAVAGVLAATAWLIAR